MKKQIFFLLLLAIFAGTSVYAQAPNLSAAPTCPVPIAVTCLSANDALHPVPGTPYDYTVTVPTPTTGTKTYNWFVTQDQNFIQNGTLTSTFEPNDGSGAHVQATGSGYRDPANGAATINITWKSYTHDAAQPVFLVIYVTNSQCATDNIQVYIIQPAHAFTLDIANIAADGSAQPADYATCVSPVVGAIYNPGQNRVDMDYGVNYLFFAVSAANFSNAWQPSFQIGGAGIAGSRVVTAVEWATPANAVAGTWNATTGSGTSWTAAGATVDRVNATAGTVGAAGECIIVRVTVDNNQAETIVDAPVSLAVNGVMLDPVNNNFANAALEDIHYTGTCAADGFTNDVITQIIAPRPDINEVTPTPFVPTNRD